MSEQLHKAEDKVDELVEEAAQGKSARTPWLIFGGLHLVIFSIVAVVLAIVFTVYLLA
jgi:hypothetical protein